MPRQLLQKQEPVGLLIAAVRRRIKQAVGTQVRRRRLTPQQFWVLVAVCEREGLSLRELADHLRMDQPTASRVIAALRKRKLVRVEEDPLDRRRARLALTATGGALGGELLRLAMEMRGVVEEGFSAAEKEALRTALLKILANIDRFWAQACG